MTRHNAGRAWLFALSVTLSVSLLAVPRQDQTEALRRADAAFCQGRFADAAVAYRRVLETDGKNGQAHAGLVRTLLKQQNVASAARAAEDGLAAVPRHAPLMAAYGDVNFRQANFARARSLYADAIAADHQCARAYLGLAALDLTERSNRRAKDSIGKAYQLNPQDPDVLRSWASTLPTLKDRVAAMEQALAAATNEDPERLAGWRAWIASRKALGERETDVVTDPRRAYRLELREVLGAKGPVEAYWLPVFVNGQKLRLVLDTGAGGICLNRKAAERSRVTMLADGVPVGGIGSEGIRAASLAVADTVRIGELEIKNREIIVFSRQLVQDCDGLIGGDVFSHFLMQISFPRRTLDLVPPDTGQTSIAEDFWSVQRRARPEFTPVRVVGHLLLADTFVNDVPGFLMVIDSGAYMHLLSTTAAAKLTALHGSGASVGGISGRARETLYTRRELTLRFGNIAQPGQFLAVNLDEQNKRTGTEIAGLIGLDALRLLDLAIDYTNGLVRFEYKPR